jgi:hypothetical protein
MTNRDSNAVEYSRKFSPRGRKLPRQPSLAITPTVIRREPTVMRSKDKNVSPVEVAPRGVVIPASVMRELSRDEWLVLNEQLDAIRKENGIGVNVWEEVK